MVFIHQRLVCRENANHEKQITLPSPTRSNIFGVPLEELMGYDGEKGAVPRVVKDCIQFLRETGPYPSQRAVFPALISCHKVWNRMGFSEGRPTRSC